MTTMRSTFVSKPLASIGIILLAARTWALPIPSDVVEASPSLEKRAYRVSTSFANLGLHDRQGQGGGNGEGGANGGPTHDAVHYWNMHIFHRSQGELERSVKNHQRYLALSELRVPAVARQVHHYDKKIEDLPGKIERTQRKIEVAAEKAPMWTRLAEKLRNGEKISRQQIDAHVALVTEGAPREEGETRHAYLYRKRQFDRERAFSLANDRLALEPQAFAAPTNLKSLRKQSRAAILANGEFDHFDLRKVAHKKKWVEIDRNRAGNPRARIKIDRQELKAYYKEQAILHGDAAAAEALSNMYVASVGRHQTRLFKLHESGAKLAAKKAEWEAHLLEAQAQHVPNRVRTIDSDSEEYFDHEDHEVNGETVR